MNFTALFKLFVYAVFLCGIPLQVAGQTDPNPASKVLQVQYNGVYQLQDSYTIIYDNTVQNAKLKEFRVTFYGPGRQKITQTKTETHPANAKIETYLLEAPISGFDEVEFSILSLHSGEIEAFPANIGAILALNELTKVPDITPPPQTPPKLSVQDGHRIDGASSNISRVLSALEDYENTLSGTRGTRQSANEQLDRLIDATAALSGLTESPELKTQISALSSELTTARTSESSTDTQSILATRKAEVTALETDIRDLMTQSQTAGVEAASVLSALDEIETRLENLETSIDALDVPGAVDISQIDVWEDTYLGLKLKADAPANPIEPVHPTDIDKDRKPSKFTLDWRGVIAIIVLASLLITAILKTLFGAKAKVRPLKSALDMTETPGVIFPASPMLAGNVAGPLSPAGQLTASHLQMLSGPYAVLRTAYQATGRIGYAQVGVPSSEDYSFGTGFLITDRHVVTNRHVHGLYGHYLLDEADPGGIEFIAEKGKEASDFNPFNGKPPLLLPGLDIAIYTLARPVTDRAPLKLKPIDINSLHPRDVVVIGYPDTHSPEKPEILAVVEDNPVFAVKRISQGQIFRHSTDTDTPIGVETSVSESKTSKFVMSAICHTASTLGGNSGSPLIDIETGQLVGVHFKGFKAFNNEEAANLAMAIAQLTKNETLKNVPGVTAITTDNLKQS